MLVCKTLDRVLTQLNRGQAGAVLLSRHYSPNIGGKEPNA
jgi:hypothetical protein